MEKLLRGFFALVCCLQITAAADNKRIVCYYDSESSIRMADVRVNKTILEHALPHCTHLIFGFAGLSTKGYEISSLNKDLNEIHYRQITRLKFHYPNLKVYLSLGGDEDVDGMKADQYINFLESGVKNYTNFIDSSVFFLKTHGFDGMDLAFPFPRNKPRKSHSQIGKTLKNIKKLFTKDFIVDNEAETHKKQFTEFVNKIKDVFSKEKLDLTLTVLPNVNSSWYFDIPEIHNKFEYINLFAFDFLTPERNPEEVDYTAPIYFKDGQERLPHYNIDFQVRYWIDNGCPAQKLNLGVATYGRTWRINDDFEPTDLPATNGVAGPAALGISLKRTSRLWWPAICKSMEAQKWRLVVDTERKYGNYYYVLPKSLKNYALGLWTSFDDPDFAAIKAEYAKQKGLGGMALYDISYDDFKGMCTGTKYPILRAVKAHFE